MLDCVVSRCVGSIVLAAVIAIGCCDVSKAADDAKPAAEKGTADDRKPEAGKKAARAKQRGPLPAYYRNVVDGIQRDKMYKIYDEYDDKIDAVRAQLKALETQRDAEIDALLTAEQRERIKALAAEAKAKRDSGEKPNGDAPSDAKADSSATK